METNWRSFTKRFKPWRMDWSIQQLRS